MGCATHTANGSLVDLETLANAPILALDVEGSGYRIGTDIPYGYSITSDPDSGYYTDIHDAFFADLVRDDSKLKIALNAKYDRSMLKKVGIVADNWCDPMIAAHLLEAPMLSLRFLNGWYLNGAEFMTYEELPKPLECMTMQECADFSCTHAERTLALWLDLYNRLKRLALLDVFWNIEMPLVPVLSDMELNGVAVDANTLSLLGEEFDTKIDMLSKGLDYWSGSSGMNHNSPDQVADLLYNKLQMPIGRVTRGGDRPSVDKRYLGTIKGKHSYIPMYLFYKELKTLKHSYVDSLRRQIVDGRIYGSFNQTRTATGRLSSSDPNLQKIPTRTTIGKRIRTAFVAPPDSVLLKADYRLIEFVMLAHQSQALALLEAFMAGRDLHTETAIRAFKDAKRRSEGKTLNYKLIFLGGTAREKKMFYDAYPGVKEWTDRISITLQQNMYARTLGGRIRSLDELEYGMPRWSIAHGIREGLSTMIQGSSAEEVKKGMVRTWKQLKSSGVKMVLQVHDEILHEVPKKIVNDVLDVIWKTYPTDELSIPLGIDVEIGDNWGEMRKLKKGEKYEFTHA